MKHCIPLFLFFLLVAACGKDHNAPLPPAKMQHLLFDIHLAEVYSTVVNKDTMNRSARNPDSLAAYYGIVFKHYGITQAEFAQSLDWYKAHPDDLDSIYTKMIPELMRLETRYNPQ